MTIELGSCVSHGYTDRSLIEKNDHRNRRHCVIRNKKAVRTCSRSWIPCENHFRQNVPCWISVKLFFFLLFSPPTVLWIWHGDLCEQCLSRELTQEWSICATRTQGAEPTARCKASFSPSSVRSLRRNALKILWHQTNDDLKFMCFLKTELNYLRRSTPFKVLWLCFKKMISKTFVSWISFFF